MIRLLLSLTLMWVTMSTPGARGLPASQQPASPPQAPAAVLHMLRRHIGDDAFFRGVRRFYESWRFAKAGTEDLRAAFEAEANRSLGPFFAGWIYGQAVPRIRFACRAKGTDAVLQFEHLETSERGIFVVPVTVSLRLEDGTTREELIVVDYRTVEVHLPLSGTLRHVEINGGEATLAEFVD